MVKQMLLALSREDTKGIFHAYVSDFIFLGINFVLKQHIE